MQAAIEVQAKKFAEQSALVTQAAIMILAEKKSPKLQSVLGAQPKPVPSTKWMQFQPDLFDYEGLLGVSMLLQKGLQPSLGADSLPVKALVPDVVRSAWSR